MATSTRSTRIVATLGPATEGAKAIEGLVRTGLDIARLNMSHGSHEWHRLLAGRVRRAARMAGRPVGLMADLQGPKVRLGSFEGPVTLKRGARIVLTSDAKKTDPARLVLPVAYAPLPEEAAAGHEILLADGTVRVRVLAVRGREVVCRVLEGHSLASRAGLALPHAHPRRSALTGKDRRDLTLAVELGVDFVALSFVRRPEDVLEARRAIRRRGGDQLLIAKIETSAAIEQLDEIIAEADAVMVARGDLGVELPPEQVPILQKRIIRDTTSAGKPVITATQMLESMREATRPTRAEASDVANAVIDGSWAVMLSAETAVGRYPVQAVRMMDRIAREAEALLSRQPRRRTPWNAMTVSEGLAEAGARLALEVGARALVALTRSGATARQVARYLLPIPIYAYTPSRGALTRMTIYRGITPRLLREQRGGLEQAIPRISRDLLDRRQARRGDRLVFLGGSPKEPHGRTSRLVVHEVLPGEGR